MDIPFRIALEKALGIVIGLMAVELLGRIAFNLSLTTEIVERLVH
jgi:hypothetical protein